MKIITRTPVLWALFGLSVLCVVGFQAFNPAVGGQYLDTLDDPAVLRETLAGMSEAQKTAHFRVTVLIDTVFPLSFGLLFAGLGWRFFGKWGPLAAVPGFAVLVVDLTENMIQALALSGAADVLDAKAWVTPLKMGLFYLAALIALVAVGVAVWRMVLKPKGG
ncbi:hypothetical protein [Hyphomonas sp.]|uniref:hypothetical protein n=1 Tax=Hyphomonas sp. TaxID=87 RepID=UPI00391D16E4